MFGKQSYITLRCFWHNPRLKYTKGFRHHYQQPTTLNIYIYLHNANCPVFIILLNVFVLRTQTILICARLHVRIDKNRLTYIQKNLVFPLEIVVKYLMFKESALRNRFPYFYGTGIWYAGWKETNDVIKMGGTHW